MVFREASVADIKEIFVVRYSVTENVLDDSDQVDEAVCENYLTARGKGWVCEIENQVAGFAIVDLIDRNVWALFIKPAYEKQGIGRQLQKIMLDWYFSKTKMAIWLTTNPNTRAEHFYRASGWKEIGQQGAGEIKFEMTYDLWKIYRNKIQPL